MREIAPKQIRDLVHNLNIKNPQHRKIYEQARTYFIGFNEGSKQYAYDDATGKPIKDPSKKKGNITVGIGFNMDAKNAREIWKINLPNVDFDEVYKGKRMLTTQQIEVLFEKTMEALEKDLRKIYGKLYDKLRVNERIAIEDCYFNYPRLVNANTKFYRYIQEYYKTGDRAFLESAIYEIQHRSNLQRNPGIQNRRNKVAELLNSPHAPFYSSPFDPLLPIQIVEANIAETIVPRGTAEWPKSKNDKYYIWRTQCDTKVRESHFALEGKIFAHDDPPALGNPGDDYNCRCNKEELPAHIIVTEEKNFTSYMYKFENDMQLFALEFNKIKDVIEKQNILSLSLN